MSAKKDTKIDPARAKSVGEKVRATRQAARLSILQLAGLLGVSDATLCRYENGEIRIEARLRLCEEIVSKGAEFWAKQAYEAEQAAIKRSTAILVPATVWAEAVPGAKPVKPAPARKVGRPHGQHNSRTCPVCGVVTKAPRFRFLCQEHRTPENLAKFARKVGEVVATVSASGTVASAPVVSVGVATTPLPGWLDGRPTDLEEALKKMERMRDMFAGMKSPTVAPAPAPSSSVAISKGVVLLALNTLKEETKFAGLAELALAALEDL